MKQTKLWLATIAALLCNFTASAHDFEMGGIYYNIISSTDLTVAVTYQGSSYESYSNEYTGTVTVPEIVTYNSNTYSVTIIEEYAFSGCSSLTSITIPESVSWIGDHAFDGCRSLAEVIIEDGDEPLSLGRSINSYPGDTWFVIKGLFGDSPLRSLYLGRDLSFSSTFEDVCTSPFCNTSLTTVTIGESVTEIGGYTFSGCSSLAAITIPESVTSIGDWAFSDCSSLAAITITEGVASIGYGAFSDCSSLISITIPESVTEIGGYAFSDCSSLTAVHINSLEAWCKILFSVGASNPLYYAHDLYLNGELVTELVIPEDVTSIGDYAFFGCSSLTSITIPEDVTSIGDYAFCGCSSLTSITIPENVTSIGSDAFRDCSSLAFIDIPMNSKLISIGDFAFSGCSNLTSIIIPESVTKIGNNAFERTPWYDNQSNGVVYIGNILYKYKGDMSNNTSIEVREGTISICSRAFYNCKNLSSITIPEGVASIGYGAFYGCSSLISITIPESVTEIGVYAFSDCSSLTSIIIPEGVTSIGSDAFYGCSSLTSIIIPEGVTSIGSDAFYGCSSLTSIIIPEGVTSIGSDAFYGCNNLNKVYNRSNLPITKGSSGYGYVAYCAKAVYSGIGVYATEGDFEFYTINDIHYLTGYIGADTELVLPDSYKGENYQIGDGAFSNCGSLTSISISGGVISIGDDVFRGCSSLTSITIPEHVTSIGNAAFSYCRNLTSITIPENSQLTSIGAYAFKNCSSLTSITIPENVTSIGVYAFDGCSSLTTIAISENSLLTSIGDYAFHGCCSLTSITIPEHVTSIGGHAFHGCSSLTSITIPEDVTSIGGYAFSGCSSLVTISISENSLLTSIGDYAFSGCSCLTSITIPKSVTSIEDRVFSGCTSLKEVIIEDGSTTLSLGYNYAYYEFAVEGLFYDCPLETVYLGRNLSYSSNESYSCSPFSGQSKLTSVAIGDSVAMLGDNLFTGCSSLTSINIPEGVTSIGNSTFDACSSLMAITLLENVTSIGDRAFSGCSRLTFVTISDESLLTSIGDYAFYGCSSLKNITLPEGVTDIGNEAFSDCSSLTSINIPASITSIGSYAFYDCSNLDAVHAVCIEAWCGISFENSSSNPLYCARKLYVNGEFVTELVVPEGVTSIGNYAFYNCSSFTSIAIPASVTSIGNYAFEGCTGELSINCNIPSSVFKNGEFTKVTIGENVTSIGTDAFRGSSKLSEVYCYAENIPEMDWYAFEDVYPNATLYVPRSSLEVYKSTGPWFRFGKIEVIKHLVTFKIGDEVIASDSLEYGATIVAPEAPEKEGHSFNGWGEMDETVPAHDVTYEGSYSANFYLLTYTVDGEVVQSDSVVYGTAIVLPEEPTKEGYTFSGWGEVPETMPAEDVVISGFFTVNTYKVYYYVGDELVHTAEVAYGEAIPEYVYEPTAEGDVFVGWVGETYETMPAHDVTYTANIESGIDVSTLDLRQTVIYDLNGRKIQVDDLRELERGVYIIDNKKVVIK